MAMLKARLFELEMSASANDEKQAMEDSKTDIGLRLHQIALLRARIHVAHQGSPPPTTKSQHPGSCSNGDLDGLHRSKLKTQGLIKTRLSRTKNKFNPEPKNQIVNRRRRKAEKLRNKASPSHDFDRTTWQAICNSSTAMGQGRTGSTDIRSFPLPDA